MNLYSESAKEALNRASAANGRAQMFALTSLITGATVLVPLLMSTDISIGFTTMVVYCYVIAIACCILRLQYKTHRGDYVRSSSAQSCSRSQMRRTARSWNLATRLYVRSRIGSRRGPRLPVGNSGEVSPTCVTTHRFWRPNADGSRSSLPQHEKLGGFRPL